MIWQKANRYLDYLLGEGYALNAHDLAFCRIFFAAFNLLFLLQPVDWIGRFPKAFFHPPPGIASLFGDFPPVWCFHLANVLFVMLLLCILAGYKTRLASVLYTLCLMVVHSFAFSFGKIDHPILMVVMPFVMSFGNWGAAISVDARNAAKPATPKPAAIAFFALIVGFAMFTAGYVKATTGWLELDSGAVQSKLFANYYARNRTDLLAPLFIALKAPFFWEALDWITVIFETGFLLAVLCPPAFRLFCGLAVIFHLLNLLMLNIDFSVHLTVYIFFLNWKRFRQMAGGLYEKLLRFLESLINRVKAWHLPVAAAFFTLVLYHYGSVYNMTLQLLGCNCPHLSGVFWLGSATLLCLALSVFGIRQPFAKR